LHDRVDGRVKPGHDENRNPISSTDGTMNDTAIPDSGTGQDSAADVILASLAAHGIDYLFCNPGTDFPPMIEAMARSRARSTASPRPIVVPHENAAVAMARGVYMVSGRPQAVMVHVNVGTANTINALIDAQRERVPVMLMAGRTPLTEKGLLARATARSIGRRRCSTRRACCARW
jgi:acetolactate synthase-1/2/3 large subunit